MMLWTYSTVTTSVVISFVSWLFFKLRLIWDFLQLMTQEKELTDPWLIFLSAPRDVLSNRGEPIAGMYFFFALPETSPKEFHDQRPELSIANDFHEPKDWRIASSLHKIHLLLVWIIRNIYSESIWFDLFFFLRCISMLPDVMICWWNDLIA